MERPKRSLRKLRKIHKRFYQKRALSDAGNAPAHVEA
jgi:hypothetical protein